VSSIKSMRRIWQRTRVIRIQMKKTSPQTYLAGEGGGGAILSHNVKILDTL
jgi:hypothetical protein